MRIQFVLQSLLMTGGMRVVCEHTRRLIARRHEVVLLAPKHRLPVRGSIESWKRYLYERWGGRIEEGLRSYDLSHHVTRFDPDDPVDVPPADVVIATAWKTAEWTDAMPAEAGRKYYLVQGYEAWTDDVRDRVDRTWKLPLRKIVVAGWLERLATERFQERVWARIPNGVDTDRFHPPAERRESATTIGMMYDVSPWKGCDDGIAALWSIHRDEPSIAFVLLGRHRLRHRLPPGTRYVRNPRPSDLPRAYQASDIFLNSSHTEGFSLTTLESMACGCALVATSVGEVPEMGTPGVDYLMVPPGDPAALARQALDLAVDGERRRNVSAAGLRLAQSYTWDRAVDLLEAALSGD